MEDTATLVLGTTNAGKLRELADLLAPLGIACCSLAGLEAAVDVEETGDSFAANAALKASQQAMALGRWVLAEDSGLAVDALGGAPGIYSARFSGDGATDARNNALLLERLAAHPAAPRSAHYACHAALSDPTGTIVAISSGVCGGVIADRPAGAGGFGYDPLFYVPEYGQTFAELELPLKNKISHRGRALAGALELLAGLARERRQ